MNVKKTALALSSMALLSTSIAQAGEIKWNGFMSVVAGKTLDTGAEYIADEVTKGTYTDELLFTPESMMALQAQSRINDKLRATVQVVAHGANGYEPSVEWAFLSYDLTSNLTINAGRIRLPLYFYSDFLDVGYSYHWIRPPVDVYSIPQSGLEGVSVRYNTYIADTIEFNAEAWYGASDLDFPAPDGFEPVGPFKVRDDMGVNALFSWEWFKLRLLYNKLNTSSTYIITETGDTFGGEESPVNYKSLAFMADYDNLIWRSEYTKLDNGSITNSGYASIGYQIGDFLPHVTSSFIDAKGGGFFVPAETASTTVGVSWGFSSSAVLKLEYITRTVDSELVVFDPTTFTLSSTPTKTKSPMFAIGIDLIF